MSSHLQRWLPLALVVLAAFWLRTHDLARRPMHADEANQAMKLGELLDRGSYRFDPVEHHGPTLYYATVPLAWLRGEFSLAALTETTVRLVPALAGTLGVLLLALLAQPLGRWPALAAAAFLALSPPAVYFSRYFIQETLLVTFTLGTLVCAQRWWRDSRLGWALATGAAAGLMQATKSSAPLFLVAALAGWFVVRRPRTNQQTLAIGRDLAFALGAAVVVVGLSYSSFGTNPAGLRDAITTYASGWNRLGSASGHEKPWWYYLQLFGWQRNGGLVWEQVAFSAVAAAGLVAAFLTKHALLRWAAVYTGVVVAVLSFSAYKTPWHAIHFVPGFALLAAAALGQLAALRGRERERADETSARSRSQPRTQGMVTAPAVAAICLFGAVLFFLGQQTRLTVFLRPADARNPYAYVHSSPDVRKFRALAAAALEHFPEQPVRVISEEYWPLPWYFRGLPRIGYWSTPPEDCEAALLAVSVANIEAVRARLRGTYRESVLGLRPGFFCIILTRLE